MRLEITDEMFEALPTGWLKRDEAQLLIDSAVLTTGAILEVGCYLGRSTVLLAHLGRQIHTVDPFDNFGSDDPTGTITYRRFTDNLRQRKIWNVKLHAIKIEDWHVEKMGFAYLDGDHTKQGTINQIQTALDCGVEHMCLHDFSDSGGGREIKLAVESMPIKVITLVGTMAYCKRKNERQKS